MTQTATIGVSHTEKEAVEVTKMTKKKGSESDGLTPLFVGVEDGDLLRWHRNRRDDSSRAYALYACTSRMTRRKLPPQIIWICSSV